jgi:hypothetical protein
MQALGGDAEDLDEVVDAITHDQSYAHEGLHGRATKMLLYFRCTATYSLFVGSASKKRDSADLVTIQAGHAALRYVCRVPVALASADEWPQDSPGDDRAEEGGEVDKVRADHPGADVRHAEIEEEPDGRHSPQQKPGFRIQRGRRHLFLYEILQQDE